MSYSQNGEEAVILEYFSGRTSPGRFLDVGAYTGVELSNTRALAELGWSGVLLEPSPNNFTALQRNYAGRSGFDLLSVGLGIERKLVRFHDCTDAVSTTEEENRKLWAEKGGVTFAPIWIHTIRWRDLFEMFPGPFDFVTIDTEGTSVDLFYDFAIEAARPAMICVEHDGEPNAKAMTRYARPFQYSELYYDGNNLILGLQK